jgi:outer membrane receptor for monomeric catechols
MSILCCVKISMALGLSMASALVAAQDDDELASTFGDVQTVSIATGSQKSLLLAPAVASVITAADIKAMGATDLDQVLESVPGLHVARQAALYAPNYLIRGISSEFNPQVLLLRNGLPMTTLFVGNKGQVWGNYPLQHVARIEIIRGPGSALYGAMPMPGSSILSPKMPLTPQAPKLALASAHFLRITRGCNMVAIGVHFRSPHLSAWAAPMAAGKPLKPITPAALTALLVTVPAWPPVR